MPRLSSGYFKVVPARLTPCGTMSFESLGKAKSEKGAGTMEKCKPYDCGSNKPRKSKKVKLPRSARSLSTRRLRRLVSLPLARQSGGLRPRPGNGAGCSASPFCSRFALSASGGTAYAAITAASLPARRLV